MDYQTKNNSKMLVIICPTTGATPIENINAILRVVELSGGIILEPRNSTTQNFISSSHIMGAALFSEAAPDF